MRETKTIIHLIKRHSFIHSEEENDDGHAALSREDHRAASNMREMSETPGDDSSETPRGMIDNRLRF